MIVLASASPRRRTLLTEAGLSFRIEVAGVDEAVGEGIGPEAAARMLAERKAGVVSERHRRDPEAARTWVVGADTVVAVPCGASWKVLGKPSTPEEARGMLRDLSSTRHRVITGVCVARADGGATETASETTWVTMRTIAAEEIEAYVASGEWRDKAGGYAIQENADAFVTRLKEGGFDNVVGLPVGLTLSLLARTGVPPDELPGG